MDPDRHYRAIVFDLDGTLIDSYAPLADAVNFARRAHGLEELELARIRTMVGHGVELLLERAFAPDRVPASAPDLFLRRYDEVCATGSRVLEDVSGTLRQLAADGFPMGVCTNKPTAFSLKILEYLGLAPYFRAVVGPDRTGTRKPEGRHLLETVRAIDASPSDCLYVGDMVVDIQAAHNAAVAVAVVPTGSSSPAELRDARPDHFLDRFSDLMTLVAEDAADASGRTRDRRRR